MFCMEIIFVKFSGDCRADASSGLPFLDMKKITRESLKKAEKAAVSIQWARFINCRIHGHWPLTWAITKKYRHEMIMRRNRWKKFVEEIVERKNGDRMQRNMPYFVRLVVDYFYDRMRKTKNLQYGDRTQNHGQYKNPYTKIWTNQARTVLFWCLLQPVQDRIPEKCWEEGLQNPEWSWYVQFQRAAQIELWTGQKAPLDVMRKELKKIIREENEKAQTE